MLKPQCPLLHHMFIWWEYMCMGVLACLCVCVHVSVCVCSGYRVVFQVRSKNCERLIMWRSGLSSATTSPKAQLPRRGGRKLDRKPQQRKPQEWLRKEQQLCGNRKGKVTAATYRLMRFLSYLLESCGSQHVLTKKRDKRIWTHKHINKRQSGIPKRFSVTSGDSVV